MIRVCECQHYEKQTDRIQQVLKGKKKPITIMWIPTANLKISIVPKKLFLKASIDTLILNNSEWYQRKFLRQ